MSIIVWNSRMKVFFDELAQNAARVMRVWVSATRMRTAWCLPRMRTNAVNPRSRRFGCRCHGSLFIRPITSASLLSPSSDGLAAFRAFLRTEFSEENLDFWLACEDYKKIKSQSKMTSKAKKIFGEFIAIQSCKEVRLQTPLTLKVIPDVRWESKKSKQCHSVWFSGFKKKVGNSLKILHIVSWS